MDLKDAAKGKLFGGKVRFRSDERQPEMANSSAHVAGAEEPLVSDANQVKNI